MRNNNRNRRQGNRRTGGGVNRVLESTGPDGKVRGNSQQIIEKYMAFSRDALLSGDRIVAENYSQHAEHYIRLYSQQKESEAQRSAQHTARHAGNGSGNQSRPARFNRDGNADSPEVPPSDGHRREVPQESQPVAAAS